jgi:uncharacterized protein YodC (DUF2158 family)
VSEIKFKEGDIVRLNSGGPKMTVIESAVGPEAWTGTGRS